jgi:hypothetical protein
MRTEMCRILKPGPMTSAHAALRSRPLENSGELATQARAICFGARRIDKRERVERLGATMCSNLIPPGEALGPRDPS